MRVAVAILALLIATSGSTLSQTTSATPTEVAPPPGYGDVAPADEYFGNLKMSVLGIRNELRLLESRVDAAPDQGDRILTMASFVEDALSDWESHYPADPWLAKSVYALEHVYSKVKSEAGRRSAMRVLSWLISRYSNTVFPEEALNDLERQ